MALIKPPVVDPSLDPFDGGVGVLTREGDLAGHVVTTRRWFWSPFSPLRRQWWVWYIVTWSDGTREPSTEDYPPWTAVDEMKDGYLDVVSKDEPRSGRYDFAWLPAEEAIAARTRLEIVDSDF